MSQRRGLKVRFRSVKDISAAICLPLQASRYAFSRPLSPPFDTTLDIERDCVGARIGSGLSYGLAYDV